MPNFYKWDDDELLLNLYVQPNAKKDELIGKYGNYLKIRVTALPVENKANKHLIKFLTKIFSVSSAKVELLKGENQRTKHVKILAPTTLPDMIKNNE